MLNILKKNNLTNILAIVIRYYGGIKLGAGGQVKIIDYILKDTNIISKEYNDNIIYKFYLSKDELNFIPELEKVAIHVSIKDKALIEND